jgi:hypothetical protein
VQPALETEAEVLERVPDGPLPPPATAAGRARVEPASALVE